MEIFLVLTHFVQYYNKKSFEKQYKVLKNAGSYILWRETFEI